MTAGDGAVAAAGAPAADRPPGTRRASARLRPVAVVVLSVIGVVAALSGVVVELLDAAPLTELWVSAAAGAAFLLTIPFVSGDDAAGLRVRARLLVGAGVSAVLAVVALWQLTERSEPSILLLLVPAVLLFFTAGLAINEAGRSGLQARSSQLRSRLEGEESERRRWARELHDQTLQDLAAIDVTLGTLARRPAAASIGPELGEVRDMVREQITVLRHLITELRPLALDALGLVPALEDLAARAQDSADVPVRTELADVPGDLLPEAQVAVYRIVQEALTNAVRHSRCRTVRLRAEARSGRLVVAIRDDGIGMGGVPRTRGAATGGGAGHGRSGMVERAAAFDGTLVWSDVAGGGTDVVLSLPLAQVTRSPSV